MGSAIYRDENGNLILKRVVNRSPMNQNKEVEGDKRYYFQASLDYNRLFAHTHRVGVFGMVYQEEKTDVNFDCSDLIGSIPRRNLAYSGRFTYAYKDKYTLLNLTGDVLVQRILNMENNLVSFLLYSAGCVISEEAFVKKALPWMDLFKIRASYGEVGNDVVDDGRRFPYISLIGTDDGGSYTFGEFGTTKCKVIVLKHWGLLI
ncbi:MAG: hypothetical protein V8R04_16515 [Bacteroides thetaiotaomicron]